MAMSCNFSDRFFEMMVYIFLVYCDSLFPSLSLLKPELKPVAGLIGEQGGVLSSQPRGVVGVDRPTFDPKPTTYYESFGPDFSIKVKSEADSAYIGGAYKKHLYYHNGKFKPHRKYNIQHNGKNLSLTLTRQVMQYLS